MISPGGETELFDIIAGVLQRDTLAPRLSVIVLDFALRMTIDGKEEELGFHLERRKKRRIRPEVPIDFDFADRTHIDGSQSSSRDITKGGSKCWKSQSEDDENLGLHSTNLTRAKALVFRHSTRGSRSLHALSVYTTKPSQRLPRG